MRGASAHPGLLGMRSALLLVAAATLWLSAGIAEAQPRTPDPTPGMAPRLPTTPVIGDDLPGLPGAPPGDRNADGPHAPDLLVAVFRPGTPDGTPNAFAESLNLRIERTYVLSGLGLRVFLMRIPAGGDGDEILRQATSDGRPLWVQWDYTHQTLDDSAGSAAAGKQYALAKIRADSLPQAARGQGITVALIDSGVARDHESLDHDNITLIDLIDEKSPPPPETHGTVVASIIAGSGKVKGLAPAADLLAIRAFSELDPKTGASTSDSFHVAQGISVALERKARIINMSLGGPNDPLVRMAVQQAVLTGVIVIAAAGNSGPDAPPCYPAAQRGVIAVTATDDKDRLFKGANRGDYVAVAAPGVAVLAAKPGRDKGSSAYDYFTGTSMATGYATGLAAVLLSADPKLSSLDIRRIMENSATDLGPPKKDPQFGWGRIDAAAAFSSTPTVGAAN
jgi:subtilisin family serine protease